MEPKQIFKSLNKEQDGINEMSKEELVDYINNYFVKHAKERLTMAIVFVLVSALYILSYIKGSMGNIILPIGFAIGSIFGLLQYLNYRKIARVDDASELLSTIDRLTGIEKKLSIGGLAIMFFIFCYLLYTMIIDTDFTHLDSLDYIFFPIFILLALFIACYVLSPKLRRKIFLLNNVYAIKHVERLRELVSQENI
jgi:hypothetical protein